MIKAAIQHIIDISKPTIEEIDGQAYSDKRLHRIKHNPLAQSIRMNTLSSLVEYIKSNTDDMKGKMIIHIEDAQNVVMYSQLDDDRERETLVEVRAKIPHFPFNEYMGNEQFGIALQAKFLPTDERALVLKFAGTVELGTVNEYGDDGVTQKATVKTGITSKVDAKVPNPVVLQAYRTFIEVEQPTSKYIFRMKGDKYDSTVKCGLYEADGGAWEIDAMKNIKEYLQKELKDELKAKTHIIIS